MKDKLILIVAIIGVVLILLYGELEHDSVVVYDCRLSEISPDFPPEVRDECRKIRLEEYKERQLQKKAISI